MFTTPPLGRELRCTDGLSEVFRSSHPVPETALPHLSIP